MKRLARSLAKAANQAVEKWRQLEGLTVLPGIKVVLPRIIDDPELPVRFGVRVRTYLVQFPVLEGRRVLPGLDAEYETRRACSAAFSVHGRSR
jgi:hypothetical protein